LGGTDTLAQTVSCAVRRCHRILVDIGKHGFQDREVDNLGAAESRQLEPNDEDGLKGKIPREVVKHEAESNALGEVKEAKDNPVCEPLDVILVSGGLKRLKGKECWNCPSNEGGYGASERVHEVEESEEENGTEDCIRFGDLGTLFERVQNGIFRELLVELLDVVVCLVRCLYEDGVLLHFL